MGPIVGGPGRSRHSITCHKVATVTKAVVEMVVYDSSSTFPPIATVLMVSVRSVANRNR